MQSLGLSGPENLKKSEKSLPGPPALGSQKVWKKSRKSPKSQEKSRKCLFGTRKSSASGQLSLNFPPPRPFQNINCFNVVISASLRNLRGYFLGQKSCRRKVPIFFEFSSRILPRILLRNCPEFFEEFSCFDSWEKETRKIHQTSPPFFNAKFPDIFEEKIHESFLES